ncbi:MAG: CopD family protein [Rhodomicrobiaceae bacterium]
MMEWLLTTVPYLKVAHIVALSLWCGGIIALPLMLSRHDPAGSPEDYRRIRRATHMTYTLAVTPAAVIAVVAGTWLIFLRELFVPWLYAKLLAVALLVAAHAWVGHIIVTVAEMDERYQPPHPYLVVTAALVPMIAILWLVLGKPDLSGIEFPNWLMEPGNRQLPFEIPNR